MRGEYSTSSDFKFEIDDTKDFELPFELDDETIAYWQAAWESFKAEPLKCFYCGHSLDKEVK